MDKYTRAEIAVGAFVVVGVALLGYLSISIGGFSLLPSHRYRLHARFASAGALKPGAAVKIAGVAVGKVEGITLVNYVAAVDLSLDRDVALPTDTIASIRTEGLLGSAYVAISPGSAEKNLAPGARISQTEPALDLVDLLIKYGFKSKGTSGSSPDEPEL